MKRAALLFLFLLVTACAAPARTQPKASPAATQTLRPPAIHIAPRATSQPALAETLEPTAALQPTVTPRQLAPELLNSYTIPALRARSYASSPLEDLGALGMTNDFTRYYIRYQSDGLQIYGFLNVPVGEGPFPVIIALHGYSNPATYETLDYTTDAADALTREGYLVLHPNLRNYQPSDSGDNLFRVGMAVDVLNLIEVVKAQGGQPGLLEKADPSRIGLWGHSMGGGIALKVATISQDVKAVLLYASTSGHEQKNSTLFYNATGSPANAQELEASPEQFQAVSPATYYADITAAVALFHGTVDNVVPLAWAEETCQELETAGVTVECHYIAGAEHTFRSRDMGEFGPGVSTFYDTYLRK